MFSLLIWAAFLLLEGWEVSSVNLPSPDCLSPTINGEYPLCDPQGIKNTCCFGLSCLPITNYGENPEGKLIQRTVYKCINRFQAAQPGSPECLKVDKDGIFPLCNPAIENGNCCIGLSCIENPARKGEYRCANKIESSFNPIGGDLSKPGGGYDPTKFIPNPSQYVPGPAKDFVPHVTQSDNKPPDSVSNIMSMSDTSLPRSSDCLIVSKSGFPRCNPKVYNGNCCIGLECIENPRKKGDFRCANKAETAFNAVGKYLSKPVGTGQDPIDFVHDSGLQSQQVMLLRQDRIRGDVGTSTKPSYAILSLSLSLLFLGRTLIFAYMNGVRRGAYDSI